MILGLNNINSLLHKGSNLHGIHFLVSESKLSLTSQKNCKLISDIVPTFQPINPCEVKQRSETWFNMRNAAKVTGNCLFKAIGLGSLKEQQNYFDNRTFCKVKKISYFYM